MLEKQFEAYFAKQYPKIALPSARAVIQLSEEGGTVPFIARYRKEKTGNLDEVEIRAVLDTHEQFHEIVKRKDFILGEIEKQGNLTAELKKRIETSMDLVELEEIYRPYKKKKKTKATIAREAGLEPLADWIWSLGQGSPDQGETLEVKAKNFMNPAAGFTTYEEVLKGASDIIVERLSNDAELRESVRVHMMEKGKVASKASKKYKPHSKFEMYADYNEPIKALLEKKASHRYLAMRRGWNEEELAVTLEGDEDLMNQMFQSRAMTAPQSVASDFLKTACKNSLNLHVLPSIGNEIHKQLKDKADYDAIEVFAENVNKVLLSSPFGAKCVLGVDPGIRTGCKLALIDKAGHFISHTVLQIQGDGALDKAKRLFDDVLKQIKIEAIAVGNGTGGREAEKFFRDLMKDLKLEVPVILVNESGASIYSASDVAREEFPDLDLTVRGAISIARRLQDPLAELVKIEPKSIGVGQYQHDVSESLLKKKLTEVVESSVNSVGVDLNTASESLLKYVSGIGPALAKNIVEYRRKNGLFTDRDDLLKVDRFSSKVFEQAAGFLRVQNGKFVLDKTGIHPERYQAVRDMAHELGITVSELIGSGARKLNDLREKWSQLIGEFTFNDILKELEQPGRDPRDPFKVFQFNDDIHEVKDLKVGMICNGIVGNVTNFGAFVDIGVHQNGLVHISELSTTFVDDPRKVVNPGDQVKVRVLDVNIEKNQIALSMILDPNHAKRRADEASVSRGEYRPRDERSGEPRKRDDRQVAAKGTSSDRGGFRPSHAKREGDQRTTRDAGFRSDRSGQPQRPSASQDRRGPRPDGRGNDQRKPAGSPFNNPFAALAGIDNGKSARKN